MFIFVNELRTSTLSGLQLGTVVPCCVYHMNKISDKDTAVQPRLSSKNYVIHTINIRKQIYIFIKIEIQI